MQAVSNSASDNGELKTSVINFIRHAPSFSRLACARWVIAAHQFALRSTIVFRQTAAGGQEPFRPFCLNALNAFRPKSLKAFNSPRWLKGFLPEQKHTGEIKTKLSKIEYD